ncbi:outer membrane protein [Qipengyuania sp. YIM B01966]|uniref:outer membrane protein n=1 Tax=Qipengyuania sp. YIM B01966 TaxID=2778646 RepID=UPI0018F744DE|nr:outer membrane beta-barrel protein [Qipengyuania sp. YIM B01966]
MKKIVALFAAASTVAVAAPVMAQVNPTFTGPRVEALVGYDVSKAGSSIDDDSSIENDQSIEGVVYGGAIGYDFAAGGAVVGIEAELTDSTAKTEFNAGDFEGFGLGAVETGRDLYVGARVGVLAQPDLLVYAKGGYTNARYNLLNTVNGAELEQDLKVDGYRLGAGVEYALSGNSYIKTEYRYSNYSNGEVDFDGTNVSDNFDIDTDRHQIMVGYGFRF